MGIIGRTLVKGVVALSTGICIVMVSVMVGYVVYDHNMAAGEVSQWAELQALFMGTAAYLGIIWGILWVSEETKSILHQVLTFIFFTTGHHRCHRVRRSADRPQSLHPCHYRGTRGLQSSIPRGSTATDSLKNLRHAH
ncbi:MAG: hypothetical protein IPJ68_04985 [Candidatus Moraniibacteriota bacterium]|nr:MAG: hypothetical protein IPJ68_04985 [Candidatus Moranbacteria bacterium]